ncbi:hypothetical protein VZG47_09740 [Synechococcus elongatus IITB5]|uniref:hypothetical protein n=1 Tax=Synechococcus elongatus TaxID=32046 RepID=UPI0030D2CF47
MRHPPSPIEDQEIYQLSFLWNGAYWTDAEGISHFDLLLKALAPTDHQPQAATICLSAERQTSGDNPLDLIRVDTYTDTYTLPAFPDLPLIPLTSNRIPKLPVWWLDVLFD